MAAKAQTLFIEAAAFLPSARARREKGSVQERRRQERQEIPDESVLFREFQQEE
jgi:hypothetical protein